MDTHQHAEDFKRRCNEIYDVIRDSLQTVANVLGVGFLEKIYENAVVHELRKRGLKVTQQQSFEVVYDGKLMGEYVADIVVEGLVLIELKAVKNLDDVHLAQCINYLRVTGLWLCVLVNFAKSKLDLRRVVLG